jgi:hypothetical protein
LKRKTILGEEEEWKEIEGYEGLYKVSNHGRVWTIKRNHEKKPVIVKGYFMVSLSKDNKKKLLAVHRLVAKAFIPNPRNKREVNHLDEDKQNNHVENLRWVTPKENANWGTRNERIAKYAKANPVRVARKEYDKERSRLTS